jgi:hypothetical protein
VIVELVALGAISAVRPSTSQAAVFALLKSPTASRSLLFFTVAGLIWSVAIGLVIVLAFDGAGRTLGRSDFTAAFDVIAGVAAIAFAAGVRRGGITTRPRDASRERAESRLATRLHNPSPLTAAAGGVVTHIPGLIYLVALNAIAADQPRNASALGLVSLYNVLWFAIPIAALTLSIVAPGTATAYLDRATAWARRHRELLLIVIFGGLGIYLVIKGALQLT